GLFEGLFRSVYKKHFDTFQTLKHEYDKSSTKNISKSFTGERLASGDGGDIPRDEGHLDKSKGAKSGAAGNTEDPATTSEAGGDVVASQLAKAGKVLKPSEEAPPAPDVYAHQSANAERIISKHWLGAGGNVWRYKFENAGDILRELAKYRNTFLDPGYIYEKINKIADFIK